MLFRRKFIIQTPLRQPETETAYRGKLIPSINRAHNCRNRIWNHPIHVVILSAFGSIYLNMKDYKSKNNMHTSENGGSLNFNYFVKQVLQQTRIG